MFSLILFSLFSHSSKINIIKVQFQESVGRTTCYNCQIETNQKNISKNKSYSD